MKNKTQYQLIKEIQSAGYNIVNCGNCGRLLFHVMTAESIFCGDCGQSLEPSDCPDFIHEEIQERFTLPVIDFEHYESNTYDFTYEVTKKNVLFEANGNLEPYNTGRGIEHRVIINNITIDFEDAQGDEADKLNESIEEEVMNAFYNQVRI